MGVFHYFSVHRLPAVLGLLIALTFAGCTGTQASSHLLTTPTCAAMQGLHPPPAATATAGHKNYQLADLGPISLQNHRTRTTWALGDTMQFDWCPYVSELNSGAQPTAEVLTATLQGPFSSFAAADAARPGGAPSNPERTSPTVYGPVVAGAAPIHTSTWSGVEEISGIHLSTSLAPGYYLFVLNILSQPSELSGESGSSGIVEITG